LILMPLGKALIGNTKATVFDYDDGAAQTFPVSGGARYSPTGNEPATHIAAYTSATDTMLPLIRQLVSDAPGCQVYADGDGWTVATALATAGLRSIAVAPQIVKGS
jgi:hypothetical protein